MNDLRFCLILFVSFLSGCTSTQTTLYNWGGYDEGIYEYYYDPVEAANFPELMEAHILQLENNNQTPAPGLYAEVGTFKLKTGDINNAISFYKKEAETWPESKPLMDAIVQNLERQTDTEESK
ncbi:hypothetical protein AHAT_41130 [Agarivorans sp. Toyoura001]|uniref:DUF4810 domain-containing protein n=1 Tax=Agarivorans sp. Toyoura001 TaxID=2283141 RepID=UPI0010E4E5E1|nr:DUF4810 domain-containing protein [Agarivorans sp. Toyoura001]GDY28223.1 hypothetical protein AHAT_41130 [Agarivorans sp. Toyoura001]